MSGFLNKGWQLGVPGATAGAVDVFADVYEMPKVELNKDRTENTPYGIDNGNYKDYEHGLIEGMEGPVKIKVTNVANAGITALNAALMNETEISLVFVSPAGNSYTLPAKVFGMALNNDEKTAKLMQSFTVKQVGPWVES